MRPQLFTGGLLVAIMGIVFYALQLPFVYYWSLPFVIGGAIMAIGSFFASESSGPVTPPEGYKFCVFCSNPVPVASDRCPRCDGVQPKER
jgi:hypothetical protein